MSLAAKESPLQPEALVAGEVQKRKEFAMRHHGGTEVCSAAKQVAAATKSPDCKGVEKLKELARRRHGGTEVSSAAKMCSSLQLKALFAGGGKVTGNLQGGNRVALGSENVLGGKEIALASRHDARARVEATAVCARSQDDNEAAAPPRPPLSPLTRPCGQRRGRSAEQPRVHAAPAGLALDREV